MKLLTQELIERFRETGSQSDSQDPRVICKFFNPVGAGTWLATEYIEDEKLFYGYVSRRVADRGVQVLGGSGYMQDYDMERLFRDARVYRIYEGTTQIQQLLIAKSVLQAFAAGAP